MNYAEPKIKILPENITNKIAAGEVIERPASVIKELIENSLDAGAKRIIVNLVASGLKLIEIIDDGIGMCEQDAILSIERHATSKIQDEKDLSNIRTYGFRGEALSSISAVSQFILTTRRKSDETGTEIVVHGGILKSVTQVGCPPGTKISVHRLFYNTPVRLKFLKGLATELSHCVDTVQKYALSHPGVGFTLIHNGKPIFEIPPEMGLSERVEILWGKNTREEMVFIQEVSDTLSCTDGTSYNISLSGFIGLPSLSRSNRSHQIFFVNKRPVYNRTLQLSFEEGYRNLIMTGKYPTGILFIDIPPHMVDVNIHPTKKEVKFRDDRNIANFVHKVVRTNLETLSPQEFIEDRVISKINKDIVSTPAIGLSPSQIQKETSRTESKEIKEEVHNKSETNNMLDSSLNIESNVLLPIDSENQQKQQSIWQVNTCEESIKTSDVKSDNYQEEVAKCALSPLPSYFAYEPSSQVPMQIFDSYLVVPEKDKLLIIDQHALHERLIFEKLKKELKDKNFAYQKLIVPIVIEVPRAYTKILEENIDTFAKIGIEIEPFGESTYQIGGICYLYEESKVKDLVLSVLDELMQGELFSRENYIESLLAIATRACKGAIKAGDKLEPSERLALVEGFRSLTPPYTCPHGRPILIELTLEQMEKSFRRRQ